MRILLLLVVLITIITYENIYTQTKTKYDPVSFQNDSLIFSTFHSELTPLKSKNSLLLESSSGSYQNPQGWVNVVNEGFEGDLDPNVWKIGYPDGSTPVYWGPATCRAHTGNVSAFCAKSGTSGVACGENYPPNMTSLMRYGPFSLQNAIDGKISFWYWAETASSSDYLSIGFSTDGLNFWEDVEYNISGSTNNEFIEKIIDLKTAKIPVLGESSLYIIFVFRTDGSGNGQGVYIDDLSIDAVGNQDQYNLSLVSYPDFGGTTIGGGNYNYQETATATAIPNPGWVLDKWLDEGPNVISYDSTINIKIFYDRVLTATFTQKNFPKAPTNLTGIVASNSQINLSWQDNEDYELNYWVMRSTNGSPFEMVAILPKNATEYQDTGLTNSSYYYRVDCCNYIGCTSSNEIGPLNPNGGIIPKAPTNLTGIAINTSQINLSWKNNEGYGLNYDFRVMRKTNSSSYQLIATLPKNITQYQDIGLTNSNYYYRVDCCNDIGCSSSNQIGPINPSARLSIASAREDQNGDGIPDKLGVTLKTGGVVISPNYQTVNQSYYIWDQSAGINEFLSGTVDPVLNLGDSVEIVGQIQLYRGLTEIVPTNSGSISILKTGCILPEPTELTLSQYLASPELYEGELLKFNTISKLSNYSWPTLNSNVTIGVTDGNDVVDLRIDSDTDIDGSIEPVWPVDLICIGSQFTSATNIYLDGYQLLPRFASDFREITDAKESVTIVSQYVLYQNWPNPFNPSTKISYSIPNTSPVNLKIFNILGQEVATLVNEEKYPGNYEINFNASTLPSGIYIYKLQAGSFVESKKMILLK